MGESSPLGGLLNGDHESLMVAARDYARERILPLASPVDDSAGRIEARELLARLGRDGWLQWAVPQGAELDHRACCVVREALAYASPLADSVFALQCLGTQPIRRAGAVASYQGWLDQARSGEAMAAFAMTEESAGSDVGGMETRARREGDDWVLDGGKKFISNAGLADFYLVLAVTAPDEKRPGLSFFMVPAETEGLRFAGELVMSEPHPLGSIALENCRVPGSALVGEENAGFGIGLATLDALRSTVAAAACGMAARALDEAVAYARQRQQFGRALSGFQLVQQKLAVMATELDAARLLTYRAAASADHGQEGVTRQTAMAKWYATEAAQRVIDQAVQIHGGSGVLAESVVDRLYRSIRALRIYEGTTEIQQLVVARDLLKERSPGA
jgi:acyl-CoA dehydrogenase